MGQLYKQLYNQMYTDEIINPDRTVSLSNGKPLTANIYGRRKWAVIRSMNRRQLYNDFKSEFQLTPDMTYEDIIKVLKRQSWRL